MAHCPGVGRFGSATKQVDHCNDDTGRAVAALHGAGRGHFLAKNRGACGSPSSPSTVTTSRPAQSAASIRQLRAALPSTSTVQAPQTPLLQPRLLPVNSARLRKMSSNVFTRPGDEGQRNRR